MNVNTLSNATILAKIRKVNLLITPLLLGLFLLVSCKNDVQASPNTISAPPSPPETAKKIKLGLLLDTSNSMDGLIEQAKSQLWTVVNELAAAKCEGAKPDLEIALYEYGNDNLNSNEGYIRQVTSLTNDLDKISQELFSLTTNGGSEFCGHVIQSSVQQLDWSSNGDDLQMIFIAGNEPFTQGSVPYSKACGNAKEKDIVVNTIFCGSFNEGINSGWKNGAEITGGNYMSIEHNRQTVYIDSPYDKKISQLNQRLNDTYVAYGSAGKLKKQNQIVQDNNASSYGSANSVKRAMSKSSHVYKNESWDLVDASAEKDFKLEEIEGDALPEEMKEMEKEERVKYIEEKKAERQKIQSEIAQLGNKRKEYVAEKRKEKGEENTLDMALLKAIKKQANTKNFVFE